MRPARRWDQAAFAAFAAYADERRVQLRDRLGRDTIALATPGRLEQVLDNLLANALDHAPPGSTVAVSASRQGDVVEIRVSDEGPGMGGDEIARAFDRFWRADGTGDGFGLGLAIVERLASADGGAVELHAPEGGGREGVVTLRHAATPAQSPQRPADRISTPA